MDNKKLIKKITIDTEHGIITSDADDTNKIEIEITSKKLDFVELNYIKEFIDEIGDLIKKTKRLNKNRDLFIKNKKQIEPATEIENEEDPEVIELTPSNIKTLEEMTAEIEATEKIKSKKPLTQNQKELWVLIKNLHNKNGRCNVNKATILKRAEKKGMDMMSFSNDLYILSTTGYIQNVGDDKYRPL